MTSKPNNEVVEKQPLAISVSNKNVENKTSNAAVSEKNSNINRDLKYKSKLTAGLLGVFLGTWGIHNFYLGYKKKAIIQLLLGTVGIIVIIGPIISGVWGFVEGVLVLVGKIKSDGYGNFLK